MHLIQEIGSYAGLAAIPGLAILSALYFSQARDVRRLRDWAGRAPERAAEQAQGGRVAPRPATPAAQSARAPAAAGTSAAAAASGSGVGTATATRPATAGNGPAGPTHPPIPRTPGAGTQTSVLPGGAQPPREPWYRRAASRLPSLRIMGILIVGIAVIGGGIAYGVTQLGKDPEPGTQQKSKPAKKKDKAAPPIKPADVSVAVLNGTTVNFFARTVGGKLEQQGFNVGVEDNSNQGQVNESVVLFKPGANREANLVRRKLGISQIEPADSESIAQGNGADVIVVLGADLAQQQPTP